MSEPAASPVSGPSIRAPEGSRPLRCVFPVMPTVFDDRGGLDPDGQRRAADFMIDGGSEGPCILPIFSEQFALAYDERRRIMGIVPNHVAGRVPVIVTTT
jgi:2-keto-3-deoxy-L-arabinonate dehydratase